jgi:Mn-dependent DtxR family transcriptional regulator
VFEATAPRPAAAPSIGPVRPIDTEELVQRTSYTPAQLQGVLRQAERTGLLIRQSDGRYLATSAGLARAARVTRGYRLWERFMSEQPELTSTLTGTFARLDVESADEVLSSQVVAELEEGLRALGRLPTVQDKVPSP